MIEVKDRNNRFTVLLEKRNRWAQFAAEAKVLGLTTLQYADLIRVPESENVPTVEELDELVDLLIEENKDLTRTVYSLQGMG